MHSWTGAKEKGWLELVPCSGRRFCVLRIARHSHEQHSRSSVRLFHARSAGFLSSRDCEWCLLITLFHMAIRSVHNDWRLSLWYDMGARQAPAVAEAVRLNIPGHLLPLQASHR